MLHAHRLVRLQNLTRFVSLTEDALLSFQMICQGDEIGFNWTGERLLYAFQGLCQ